MAQFIILSLSVELALLKIIGKLKIVLLIVKGSTMVTLNKESQK